MVERRAFELEVAFTSPYKRTKLFVKEGKAFFGRWRPADVRIDGDEEEVVIPMGLEGHLDLISNEVYGDRRFWRAIAHANKIDFPLRDVVPGMTIIVPKPENVRAAYLAMTGRAE